MFCIKKRFFLPFSSAQWLSAVSPEHPQRPRFTGMEKKEKNPKKFQRGATNSRGEIE